MLRISIAVILYLLTIISPVRAMAEESSMVVDLSTLASLEQLVPQLADKRVVFVGETHDRYDHHLNQLAIIKNKYQQDASLAIGIEFIQQPFQSVLDDYIAGAIDEAQMLRQTQYFDRWRYDFRLYRPIFSFARENSIPLIALNIDRDITDKVKNEGVDSLSEEQKQQLPKEIYRDDAAYRERLENVFKQHPSIGERAFESFMEVQLLWDESMAERAAQWMQGNPDSNMVILAGSGHVMYGSGIPDRLVRRLGLPVSRILQLNDYAALSPELGDFVILSTRRELPSSGTLGVMLDTEHTPPKIRDFVPESGARKAGLKKQDTILAIDDEEITSYADIRIALLDKEKGQAIKVRVARKRFFGGEKSREFEVILK